MTEEERQKTILELEQQVLGNKSKTEEEKCIVCGDKLIDEKCPDCPPYKVLHHYYLMGKRREYTIRKND